MLLSKCLLAHRWIGWNRIIPVFSCVPFSQKICKWNVRYIACIDCVQKCRDSSVSNQDEIYPTFIRTIPSTAKVSKSLISLMEYFQWTTFQAVVGNNSIWREAASTLRTLSGTRSIHMNPDVYFQEPYIEANKMHLLLEATHKKTRSKEQ